MPSRINPFKFIEVVLLECVAFGTLVKNRADFLIILRF